MAIELPQTVGPFVSDGNIAAGFQPVRYTPGVLAVLEPFGEAASALLAIRASVSASGEPSVSMTSASSASSGA
jgi:hypothetical protein